MRRQKYPERWITGGGSSWFNWDYKHFLFYNKTEEKVIKIQTRVEGASPENVWLGIKLLRQPKKCCSWFMSQTIDTTIITHLSFFWWNSYLGKGVVFLTQRVGFFKPHHHHSEIDEKAQTRLWHLWDGSISRSFPTHLNRARINFEDPPRDFRGAAEEVSISTKVWISCIVPNPPSQLLSALQFCLFNVSV